jgi:TolA-binding protein
MKRNLLIIAVLLLVAAGCNHSTKVAKTTEEQVKKAEAALFNSDMSANVEAVPEAIATFSKYAEENPEAENAAEYLFKAFEVSVNTKQDPKQSIGFADRLLSQYPKFDKNPVTLFMLATFVYDDQLHNLDKARECYQRIIDEYPESPFARDAAISIEQLGVSPEELIRRFEEASAE